MGLTHLNEVQISTLLRLADPRPRDYALLSMSAYTALRIGDILKLNVADIRDEYGRIRQRLVIRQKKTGHRLEITLPELLRNALRRYLDARRVTDPEEPLFVNLDHNLDRARQRGTQRLSRVGAHKIFKQYLGPALGVGQKELAGLATHTLRRSLAMMIYEKHGLRATQALLGHKSIASTGAYLDKLIAAAQADEFREGLNFAQATKSKTKLRK